METKFLICRRCGNLVDVMHDAGIPMMCCGAKMEALAPNSVEASEEKHRPIIEKKDGEIRVNVGAANHPMQDDHFIEWIYVQTENGGQRRALKPGDDPVVTFALGKERAVAVYAYCNLHGLWMAKP